MSIQKEFRVVVPVTCEEYRVGQLYSVAKASNQATTGDSGVEVLKNEPFEQDGQKGQYTHKIYHLGTRLPGWISALAPASALKLDEEAWNAFPTCKTGYALILINYAQSPFMGDRFVFKIESKHFDNDKGDQENVHDLDSKALKARTVEVIDICDNSLIKPEEYKEEEDPNKFHSEKTGRGPLEKGTWMENTTPIMTAYKLVTIEFRWWGLQNKVQNFAMGIETGIFAKFHRQLFCWIDEWAGWTMDDVRAYEEKLAMEMGAKIAEQEANAAK